LSEGAGWRKVFAPGLASVKHNWPPIVLVQAAALAMVVLYYREPHTRAFADGIAALKASSGVPGVLVTGAVAGGLMPEVAKALTGRLKGVSPAWFRKTLFTALVYAFIALFVDIFYKCLAATVGNDSSPGTVLVKTLIDQFVFSPFLSIPFATAMFDWRSVEFSLPRLGEVLRNKWYSTKVMPGLVLCWVFWPPVLLCAYAMPLSLQFVFCMIIEAAWSIIFVFIASHD